MKKIAAIDIGTNSVLYSLFEIGSGKRLHELHFDRESPRIGGGLYGERKPVISNKSYHELLTVLSRYVRHAEKNEASPILLAATNPLRRAANGPEIRDKLQDDLGQQVQILSPAREAQLSFLGAAGRLKKSQTAIVIDMGGGSTELVVYRGERRLAFHSLPEGAVSLTAQFESSGKVDPARFSEFELYLSRYNKKIKSIACYCNEPIYLVGGTSSALAYMKAGSRFFSIGRTDLTEPKLAEFVYMMAAGSVKQRRRLLDVDRARAEIIFAGAFWLWHLFKTVPIVRAQATVRGLRHGMALDFLARRIITP
jgi:exopolyphosphatase/guanosine-5'-triphosphate,3'-diphosphate pyrophosphatase